MKLGILPELTKDYIFQRISQEDVMEKYLQIPVVLHKLLLAPSIIRSNDNSPTCSFYYTEQGRLRFRDLSGAFWGDCFDVVALALQVDSKQSRAFQLILHTIAKDFRLHKYVDEAEVRAYASNTRTFFNKKKARTKLLIKVVPRAYNYHDKSYWDKFNVNEALLRAGNVYFAQEIHMVKEGGYPRQIYSYNPKDPAYCYYGGKDLLGNDNWKIYYPLRKKGNIDNPRFHANSSFLQGKHLVTCGRVGIITKAYKDVLSFRSFGLQAVAPFSESVLLSKKNYWFMKTKFDFLVSCMDYDRTGITMAIKLYKKYRIPPVMFTNGTRGTINYGVKDFAEHVDVKGVPATNTLLHSLFDKHEHDFQELDAYTYESLKFIT